MAAQIRRFVADARLSPVLKTVSLGRGVTLPYVEQGDPAGPAMLLLHGYTDSWCSFAGVLRHLPSEIRAIAVTQRGHGDASRPAGGYHPRTLAADVAAFMDAIGLPAAIIVGHSMGSLVAQRLAISDPDRVSGLVLIGAFATLGGNPAIAELWDSTVDRLTDPVDPGFVRAFQESTLARPVAPAFLDMVVAESLKVPARVWRAALAGQIDEDVSGELDRVRAPTLAQLAHYRYRELGKSMP